MIKYATRENSSPQGKARVLFCGTKEDYEEYFEILKQDVLSKINCAFYFFDYENEDMESDAFLNEAYKVIDSIQLVIVAVSEQLLYTDNVFKSRIIPYIKEKKAYIPVILEDGLLLEFGELFGDIQFMDKYELYEKSKGTELSYDYKLSKRLAETLLDDEMQKKVRDAFDAYIFLSYRKKDRSEAQRLMKLIHSKPECEDIAIWYDEFLVPGENFNEAIAAAMDKSQLFALVVTQNLLERGNYVLETEYPNARKSKKPIVPVEMQKVDMNELCKNYEKIEESFIPIDQHGMISDSMLEALRSIAILERSQDPMHKYLIGLAYLNGIDVENDGERGTRLIENAAEGGLICAMEKLALIYKNGEIGVPDYALAAKWQKQALEEVAKKDDDFDHLFEVAKDLYQIYEQMEDEEGVQYCSDTVLEYGKKCNNNILVFGKLFEAIDWLPSKEVQCELYLETLRASDEFVRANSNLDAQMKHMEYWCAAAKKFKNPRFYKGIVHEAEQVESYFVKEMTPEIRFRLYYLVTDTMIYVTPIEVDAPREDALKLDEQHLSSIYIWQKIAKKNIALCEQMAASKNPEWELRLADSRHLYATGIAWVISVRLPEFVSEELDAKMQILFREALEAYKQKAGDFTDYQQRVRYIDLYKTAGYMLFRCNLKVTETVEIYQTAIDEALKLYKEYQDRESQLLLWNTVTYCCELKLEDSFADRAIEIASEMYESSTPLHAKRHLAQAYSYSNKEDNKKKAIELYESIQKATGKLDRSEIERLALDYTKVAEVEEDVREKIRILEKAKDLLWNLWETSPDRKPEHWYKVRTDLMLAYEELGESTKVENLEKLDSRIRVISIENQYKKQITSGMDPQRAAWQAGKCLSEISEQKMACLYFEKAGDYQNAIRCLMLHIMNKPISPDYQFGEEMAQKVLAKLTSSDEELLFKTYNVLGMAEEELKKYDEAKEAYTKALYYFEHLLQNGNKSVLLRGIRKKQSLEEKIARLSEKSMGEM